MAHPGEEFALRSAAGCGRSSAARAQRDCPAAPPEVEASVPVGRSASRAPPPPRPWRRSSVPVGRRSAASPPFLRTSTVVESSCQGHADGLLLVPKHRAQPPLSTPPSSSRGLPAELIHCWSRKKQRTTQTCLSLVVVVVVVVRTLCICDVSVHATQHMHY